MKRPFLAIGFLLTAAVLEPAAVSATTWTVGDGPCAPPIRYTAPSGVRAEPSPGLVPAGIDGHTSAYRVPPKLGFDLGLNPVGGPFDETRLKLGRVEIDRKSGLTTLDQHPISDRATTCIGANAVP